MDGDNTYTVKTEQYDIHRLFMLLPEIWKNHSIRVARAAAYLFGTIVQEELYEEEQVFWAPREIEQAVLYHDVGLVLMPIAAAGTDITCTYEQCESVKCHTVYGAGAIERFRQGRILSPGESGVWRLAAEAAIGHHEHWDGRGYPHGELATAIPLISRITAVVDFYDTALLGKAGETESVLGMLKERSGTQFDPRLVMGFEKCCFPSEEFGELFKPAGRTGRLSDIG